MDYKSLLTQVQKTLATLDTSAGARTTVARAGEIIAANFRNELGITGGRLYERKDDGSYELVGRFGEGMVGDGRIGIQVPADYRPIIQALENGIIVMDPNDPGVDPVLEKQLGAKRFAAIAVADGDYIVSFNVSDELGRDDILFSLNLVRYVTNQKLRAERYATFIAEAQRIQQSILPQRMPDFSGFDICGRTVPAEIVGGDFYDFIPVSEGILGLAIADASGHGLPAALVVRDIHMGLRMGTDRDFKIIRTLEKLNRIIHRSRLTTKFVSLFYGELETGGIIIYSNAGHNPPFVLKKNRVELLQPGGTVLGPTPNATYRRGYAQVAPGDILCLYTDGIVEARDSQERELGLQRLQTLVRKHRDLTAKEIVTEIFERLEKWSWRQEDDRTLVIIKALPVE